MIRKPRATPTATGIRKLRSESAEHSSAVRKEQTDSKERKLVKNIIKQSKQTRNKHFESVHRLVFYSIILIS